MVSSFVLQKFVQASTNAECADQQHAQQSSNERPGGKLNINFQSEKPRIRENAQCAQEYEGRQNQDSRE
jgi:hypothetical protein